MRIRAKFDWWWRNYSSIKQKGGEIRDGEKKRL